MGELYTNDEDDINLKYKKTKKENNELIIENSFFRNLLELNYIPYKSNLINLKELNSKMMNN